MFRHHLRRKSLRWTTGTKCPHHARVRNSVRIGSRNILSVQRLHVPVKHLPRIRSRTHHVRADVCRSGDGR